MKVLFVSSSPLEYSASSNMRNIALLKGFIENGYEIYTLTPEPQKESLLYDKTICNINIKKKYFIPLGTIHSALTMKKNKKAKIKEDIYKFVKKFKIYDFRSSLAKKEVQIEEQFDLMISSSDPKSSHLIAKNLKRRNPNIAKKWIQYWGDPFADDINNKNFIPDFMVQNEEKKIISLADVILYVSPFTLANQQKRYPRQAKKMFFLPIPYNEKILYEPTANEKLTLGYFGDYQSRNRNIYPLYNAIKNEKNNSLIICGNSDLELTKKDNIKIFRRQPIENIRKMEAGTDILVCICNKKGTQIPGKIYHYSATNKPIVILIDGEKQKEMEKYFKSFNRFILCKNEENEILKVVEKFKKEKTNYQPLEKLEAKNIVKELIDESEKNK